MSQRSAIVGKHESFRNNITRCSELFPENFRCNLTYTLRAESPWTYLGRSKETLLTGYVRYYEGDIFSDSFFHHIFESENFRIPFYL